MIKATDIYAATHDGLDIIMYYYPQAESCVDNKKKFKRRPEEDDASACLKKYEECYKVTDFGDSGTAMSPIDICMYEENVRFPEAIALLASRYNVTDELRRSVNKPDIRKRPASADEKEGEKFFELEEKFTDEQLRVLGPRVKQEHVDALHWYVAKSISYVRNREVTTKYTTPTYPIFMRECIVTKKDGSIEKFYKVYEPLNPDKQWRFSYTPEGVKPKQYINGLAELKTAHRDFNAVEEKLFFNVPANKDVPYKEQKLKEAFICSGERDALCLRALGYNPLWFNSETYKVTPEEIKEIYKYVERIYNIPDIDDTGVLKGTELALRFLDIYTIWLPDWLRGYRDQRGKSRKDFRDFVEMRPKQEDFNNLLTLAMPARFWEGAWSERSRKMTYEINTAYLHYFLTLNGFYTLKDDNSKEVRYIHREGCIVSEINAKEIVAFLKRFAIERYLPVDIRNLILNSPRTGESSLGQLDEVSLDFRNYTPTSQYIFFEKETWEVTKDGINCLHGRIPGNRSAWKSSVITHKVNILPPMFTWLYKQDAEGNDIFDIDIQAHQSCFFNYLINTSRLHWRKELEYAWKDKGVDEADNYQIAHKFDIAGPLLTENEIREQKQNLLNKIYAIGYNMHRYKSPSRAWALYAMDNKIGEDDECNGRSGKSFLFKAFRFFMRTVNLSGRNPRLLDNPHVFDQVDVHTDFVLVDDCDRYLPMSQFYDNITSGMTVNPKNNKSFFIEFEESPKFGFTTNYVPREFDPSTSARMLYMVFSDYYHQKTEENDYLESRSIRDDFDRNLMTNTDYSENDWNWDLNFFAQCLQFYLSMADRSIKIQPPMDNIIKRKQKADMGSGFEDWAYCYFAEDGENVNVPVQRDAAYEDFISYSKAKRDYWTMQRFTKALKSFSQLCSYISEMNPVELLNSSGRFLQKREGKTKEMIYMRTCTTAGEPSDFKPIIDCSDGDTPF
ncbi:MAG: hypothetical protein HUK10_01300 [Bacteroides heparinolyticus]|nr:hypothetical protein [Bacteroides heparinolyticus]